MEQDGGVRYAVVALLVTGCVHYAPQTLPKIHGPDGHLYWGIDCRTMQACRRELSRQCPGGYETMDVEQAEGRIVMMQIGTMMVSRHVGGGAVSLWFRCDSDP